jgi:hypothetical protein
VIHLEVDAEERSFKYTYPKDISSADEQHLLGLVAGGALLILLWVVGICRGCARRRMVKEERARLRRIEDQVNELVKRGPGEPPPPPPVAPQPPPPIDKELIKETNEEDLPSWATEIFPNRLYINPESRLIELVFEEKRGLARLTGFSVQKEGSVHEVDNAPPVHTAPGGFGERLPLGEHLVQPYVMLGESENDPKKRKRLALRAIIVTKTAQGLQWAFSDGPARTVSKGEKYPNYADLQLHHCRTVFSEKGVAKAQALVTCELTFKPGYVPNNKVTYKTRLDANGRLDLILAPDFVTLCEVRGDGIKLDNVPKKPAPTPIDKPKIIEPDVVDPNALTALPTFNKNKAIFMCDVSSSMSSQRDKLREGLRETINRYCASDVNFPHGREFCVVPWGNRTDFPHGQRWLTGQDKSTLLAWANAVDCNQSTNMKQAMEAVANCQIAKTARYIVMMCDGDVNIDEAYLRFIKQRMPELQHVSFVAFGSGAGANMEALAKSNGGAFYKFGRT